MPWLYFVFAGLFEVSITTYFRYMNGFRNMPWTGNFIVCIGLSMFFLD